MKQNKRFYLVALVLLLVGLLCAGIAYADATITGPDDENYYYYYKDYSEKYLYVSSELPEGFDHCVWTSSDPTIAEVDKDYNSITNISYTTYSVKAPGKVIFTVSLQDKDNKELDKGTLEVKYTLLPAKDITFSGYPRTSVELAVKKYLGYYLPDYVKINPKEENADLDEPISYQKSDLVWTVEDPTIARINKNGSNLYGLKAGETKVKATLSYTGQYVEIPIKVVESEAELVKITGVSFSSKELTYVVGEGFNLQYRYLNLTPSTEDYNDYNWIWVSDDSSVVWVNENGYATAEKEGSANITVTLKENPAVTDTCKINVTKKLIPVTGLSFALKELTVDKNSYGYNLENLLNIEPSGHDTAKFVWSVDDTSIAQVNEDGYVTFKKEGKVVVKVELADDSTVTPATITVNIVKVEVPVTGISFRQNAFTVKTGDGQDLSDLLTVAPDDATNKNVLWTTSDKTVATVDNYGYVETLKAGTVVITATSKADATKTATVTITVVDVLKPLTAIGFAKPVVAIESDDELDLTEYVIKTPVDSDSDLIWSVDDATTAKVTKDGKLIPMKAGTVKVTATSKDDSTKYGVLEVTIKAKDAIEKLSFTQSEFTFGYYSDDEINLKDYLIIEPANNKDSLKFIPDTSICKTSFFIDVSILTSKN